MPSGEWEQGIVDPHEKIGKFASMVNSMSKRYAKAGSITGRGYLDEPPRALRAVELLDVYVTRCHNRKQERCSNE